jgi:microcystin-dependent protein
MPRLRAAILLILAGLAGPRALPAFDSSPLIGEITLTPYNFTPRNWMPCNGQLLPIASYAAVFSILGTTYGGNGTSTFALPNLNGAMAIGAGQGTGLSQRQLGDTGGQSTVILNVNQIPSHNHSQTAAPLTSAKANVKSPATGSSLAQAVDDEGNKVKMYVTSTATTALSGLSLTASAGGGQPMPIQGPYLNLHYIICVSGVYPSH